MRIAHQATACVDASIRWRIRPDASDALFQNYREFSSIRSSLVDRQLSSSLNKEFASYDALAVDEKGNPTTPTLAKLSEDATKDMRDQIGDQIEVLSVIIPVIKLDDNTQSKTNALLAQVAQTRIAEQGVKTAEQQAKANEALAKSVSKDPNVLVSKCLDMVEGGKVTLPAGFSCWPSSGSAVVVPPPAPRRSNPRPPAILVPLRESRPHRRTASSFADLVHIGDFRPHSTDVVALRSVSGVSAGRADSSSRREASPLTAVSRRTAPTHAFTDEDGGSTQRAGAGE